MTTATKKICFVLSSDVHVRNYITSHSLDDIAKRHDCIFLASEATNIPTEFKKKQTVKTFSPTSAKEHRFLFNLMMFSLRNLSSTFQFRIKRFYFYRLKNSEKFNNSTLSLGYSILRACFRFGLWLMMMVLTLPIIRSLTIPIAKQRLKTNLKLRKLIKEFDPDLIICPSSAYDPDNMDILSWAEGKRAKTMLLIDNWDNLSSKSVLFKRPDYMSVWGEQSVEHAVNIHQMKRQQIFTLGTPRFDQYFRLREKRLKSPFPFPYFLFVGTAVEFDERAALVALNEIIEKNDNFKKHKVIYRPHPWRQSNSAFSMDDLKHVMIDPQIAEAFQSGDKKQQPDLDYYPALLQNAKCCIGGMTTMLIESLLMKTPFLAMIWEDKNFVTNMRDVYKNYMHFNNIESISSLYFNKYPATLSEDLSATCSDKVVSDTTQLNDELNYFYTIHEEPFAERLNTVIKAL